MRIYLDDIRIPTDPDWVLVTSYKKFTELIMYELSTEENLHPQPFLFPLVCDFEISFDHDLEIEHYHAGVTYNNDYDKLERTGYHCAKWLVDMNIIPKMFWVHSGNFDGGRNILYYLNNWYKHNGMEPIGFRTAWPFNVDEREAF